MKDARMHNPNGHVWRLRYIDERTGRLNVRYYQTYDGALARLDLMHGNTDYTPVDICFWSYGKGRWVKYYG